ncbi:MAG: RICIN domain-containing protein, partial [Byssovorax sp.]
MNTRRIFAPLSRRSLTAILLVSLAPVGCVAGTEESDEEVGADDDAITSGAVYSIKGVQSGKCVGVSSASKSDGANVDQSTCDGSSFQQWKLSALGNDVFKITAQHSGKCLDIKYDSTANGANVQQMACDGAADQKWRVTALGNGELKLAAQHSGKCLDVAELSTQNGGNLH